MQNCFFFIFSSIQNEQQTKIKERRKLVLAKQLKKLKLDSTRTRETSVFLYAMLDRSMHIGIYEYKQ